MFSVDNFELWLREQIDDAKVDYNRALYGIQSGDASVSFDDLREASLILDIWEKSLYQYRHIRNNVSLADSD